MAFLIFRLLTSVFMLMSRGTPVITPLHSMLCSPTFTVFVTFIFPTLTIFQAFSTCVSVLHPISKFLSPNTLAYFTSPTCVLIIFVIVHGSIFFTPPSPSNLITTLRDSFFPLFTSSPCPSLSVPSKLSLSFFFLFLSLAFLPFSPLLTCSHLLPLHQSHTPPLHSFPYCCSCLLPYLFSFFCTRLQKAALGYRYWTYTGLRLIPPQSNPCKYSVLFISKCQCYALLSNQFSSPFLYFTALLQSTRQLFFFLLPAYCLFVYSA